MNLPNKITVLRILLVPVFMILLLIPFPYNNIVAFFVFLIAACTDFIDGHLARSRNLVTNFGKFLDPLADKLLVAAALIALVGQDKIPSWFATVIIAREFIVTGIRLIANGEGRVIAASMWGKAKTMTQIIAISLLMLDPYRLPADESDVLMIGKLRELFGLGMAQTLQSVVGILATVMILVALVITIYSGYDYLAKNKDVLKLEDC
ncbi:MAG: CDP-diacylglycerol--glycerol-3-phosphate 3-phosphatidyltransferase [Clostridia bacterium]|nr:CDP-diacylglycerol--glycerol-3-phosphate 3-phosphatidyltransferase [Clostridia bacterium]